MLSIGMCDDESSITKELGIMIHDILGYEIEHRLYEFNNGYDLLYSKKVFNILFLDFDMPAISGIELARKIREFDTEVKIVYLTNYAEYRELAFTVHAFGYLLKPVNKEKLFKILMDAKKYVPVKHNDGINFLIKNGMKNFRIEEIVYFEYYNRDVLLHTLTNIYTLPKTKISDISKKMEIYDFVITHKSFIVNLDNVNYAKGFDVFLVNDNIVPLSQKYAKKFRELLSNYQLRKIEKGV